MRHVKRHLPVLWRLSAAIAVCAALLVSGLAIVSRPASGQTAPADRWGGGGEPAPPLISEVAALQLVKHRVEPEYPATARQFHITGRVISQITVGADGKVESVDQSKGPDILSATVKTSLRKWLFMPFTVAGKPVRFRTTITISFNL
jgi:TonB family protein